MKNIVRVLLEEGIDESMIHRVLDLIEEEYEINETSDKYKADKIQDAINKLGSIDKIIGYLRKTNAPKEVIDDLEGERAKCNHETLPKIERIEQKQVDKKEE